MLSQVQANYWWIRVGLLLYCKYQLTCTLVPCNVATKLLTLKHEGVCASFQLTCALGFHRVCQDEKLMVVLKKTKSDWRLFWVVALVGTSFTLALAAIKCGGDLEATMVKSTKTSESQDQSTSALIIRPVFGWRFLLFHLSLIHI